MEKQQAVAVVCILVALYLGVPIEIGKADGLCFGTEENKTTFCHMNASCFSINNQSLCSCKPGFTGNGSSCHNIDECLSNKCPENSTCIDTIGSFICSCDDGYVWNGSQCVDACLTNGDKCHDHAYCSSSNGSYFCICAAGHTGNGTFCEKNDVNCTDFPGSCCASRNGFSKNDSGHCVDIDECQNGTDACSQSSVCVNTEGSYTCTCKSGFSGNGTHCQEIDPCSSESLCHSNATCTVVNGTYRCICNNGFIGNGTYCENDNECDNHTICNSQAECFDTRGSYFCMCKNGYTGNGTHCSDIDECHSIQRPCRSFDACVNTIGSFKCQDRCRRSSCPELSFCRNTQIGPLCRCIDGLYLSNKFCIKAKTIFRVDGIRLNRTYVPRYADRRSSEFTELATEVESQFLRAFRGTKLGPGLKAIQIYELKRGSVVLSFYLLFDQRPPVTTAQIAELVKNRSFHLSFSQERQTRPAVRVTNHCETGSHGCDKNARCIPTPSRSDYQCQCKAKYEMRNGKCRKSRTYAEIIIPSVIGGLLFLFFTFLLIALSCKKRQLRKASKKEAKFYEPHLEIFRVEAGNENCGIQMQDTSSKETKK